MTLRYNPEDKNSIVEYAQNLKGKTLRVMCDVEIINHTYAGKGHFGQILEKFYFFYEPNSNSEPDFPIAGVELKSSPLKKAQKERFSSKERLVLNIINYLEIVNQDFETSAFWKKNAYLLLVFYLHEADTNSIDYIIKLVDGWDYPNTDLEIIKKDWEFIRKKVADGKAHELSEGDTFYLGACTKGGKGGNPRNQPNNDIPAKQRAFSLKQGYVNHIIASIAGSDKELYGKIIESEAIIKKKTIEEIVLAKFEPFIGKTDMEIESFFKQEINKKAKQYHSLLSKAILGIDINKEVEEFEKANISIKTIVVEENNQINEHISFKNFQFIDIHKENDWYESTLKNDFEQKFFFVFFQRKNGIPTLSKVKFWNMPFHDLEEVKEVWLKTKDVIKTGNIVKKVVNNITFNHFPKPSEHRISHVRPKGFGKNDTYPLPFVEINTDELKFSKQCFWLNNTYVRDEIYLK